MVFIAPSILAADLERIDDEIKKIPNADFIHIDVMDGKFVEQKTVFLNPEITKRIRKLTKIKLDAHLMVKEPLKFIKSFADAGADYITVHAEAKDAKKAINEIKKHNVKAGISLNPETPLKKILGFLKDVDLVLVMSVHPGKVGQKYIESATKKTKQLRKIIDEKKYNVLIEVDGGIKIDNAYKQINAGADILVSGSGIFSQQNYKEAIEKMKQTILIGSDHAGFELKQIIMKELNQNKIAYEDVGCYSEESCDYPDYAKKVAERISNGSAEKGILICGTGIGMSIAANRYKGVRATLCRDEHDAEMSRKHNNSNVLVLGGRITKPAKAKKILNTWLTTQFEGGRHQRRVEKMEC